MTTDEPVVEKEKRPLSEPQSHINNAPATADNTRLERVGSGTLSASTSRAEDGHSISPYANRDLETGDTEHSHGNHEPIPNTAYVHPTAGVSQWSHQVLAPKKAEKEDMENEEDWQDMPAFAPYDIYDDNNRLIAREAHDIDDGNPYEGLGGAGKGYTRVQVDEDARSATSMDDNTSYLFKHRSTGLVDEDEDPRDPLAQMQATKDLLTEGQRIAYVGMTRLAMSQMVKELDGMEGTKATKKELRIASESVKLWSQQMMMRLYAHMEIDSSGIIRKENIFEECC